MPVLPVCPSCLNLADFEAPSAPCGIYSLGGSTIVWGGVGGGGGGGEQSSTIVWGGGGGGGSRAAP